MGLVFQNNYNELNDREFVSKIKAIPYNEEVAAFLPNNWYAPLLHKLYRVIFDNDPSWYEDCLGDLFDYLKRKNRDWNRLRTFEWRSKVGLLLSCAAWHHIIEIVKFMKDFIA